MLRIKCIPADYTLLAPMQVFCNYPLIKCRMRFMVRPVTGKSISQHPTDTKGWCEHNRTSTYMQRTLQQVSIVLESINKIDWICHILHSCKLISSNNIDNNVGLLDDIQIAHEKYQWKSCIRNNNDGWKWNETTVHRVSDHNNVRGTKACDNHNTLADMWLAAGSRNGRR